MAKGRREQKEDGKEEGGGRKGRKGERRKVGKKQRREGRGRTGRRGEEEGERRGKERREERKERKKRGSKGRGKSKQGKMEEKNEDTRRRKRGKQKRKRRQKKRKKNVSDFFPLSMSFVSRRPPDSFLLPSFVVMVTMVTELWYRSMSQSNAGSTFSHTQIRFVPRFFCSKILKYKFRILGMRIKDSEDSVNKPFLFIC